jgi:hypothetical protein
MSKIILLVGAGQEAAFIQKAISQLVNAGFEVEAKKGDFMDNEEVNPKVAELEAEIAQLDKVFVDLLKDADRIADELTVKEKELAQILTNEIQEMLCKKIEDEVAMENALIRLNDLDAATNDAHTEAMNFLEQNGTGNKANMNDHFNFIVQEFSKGMAHNVYSDEAYKHVINAAAKTLILAQRMRSGDVEPRFYENPRPVIQEA